MIPTNATNQEFIYKSDNPSVASVNAIGRVTGIKEGKAVITVSCGKVKNQFILEVVEEETVKNYQYGKWLIICDMEQKKITYTIEY